MAQSQAGRLWSDGEFRRGAIDMLKVTPGVCAWGLVTGVAMVKSGMDLHAVLTMSLLVFAASAQLAAIPLMLAGAPISVVWLAATCVNLRFVVFSAEMRRYMLTLSRPKRLLAGYLTADMTFALMHRRYEAVSNDELVRHSPVRYFIGLTSVNWLTWNLASLLGIALADRIPMGWGLELAGALALLGLAATLMNDAKKIVIGLLAATIAVVCHGWPYKMGVVLALLSSIVAGYGLETVSRRLGRADPSRSSHG